MSKNRKIANPPKRRSIEAFSMIVRTGNHAGTHHNRTGDVAKGSSRKAKHKARRSWDSEG